MSGTNQVEKRMETRAALLFFLLGFIAYYSILNSYFLSDDFAQIGKVLGGDWSTVWGREYGGFFRPLFILSYILDGLVWRERSSGYHATNIALHALNSYLIYRLTLRLLRGQKLAENERRDACFAAALLFLLHPSHTEAVSWISGRADLLAALFCLTALLCYISYMETGRARPLLLALLSFALALLSKEAAATLPLILFIVGLYFARAARERGAYLLRALKTSALFFAVLFIFVLVRRAALGAWLGGYGASQHLNFSPGWIRDRFLQACLRSLLPALPRAFSIVLLKPLQSTIFILCAIAITALVILLLRRRKRLTQAAPRSEQNRLVLLLVSSFILSLLPVINLRLSLFDTQGERFVYWPSAFTSMLVSYLALLFIRSRRWRLALLMVLLAFYFVSLYGTNQTWREAAEVSRSISEELARSASGAKSVIVINAPDNLRGVPVFHNGLVEALTVFQPGGRIEAVRLLALHDIQSLNDRVELKREDETFSLRLMNSADVFTHVADRLDCLEVTDRTNDALRFRLSDCTHEDSALFFFNEGKMYRVIDSGQESTAP